MKYPTKDKVWFLICSLSIITSTFIHECAHGLSWCWINLSESIGYPKFFLIKPGHILSGGNIQCKKCVDEGLFLKDYIEERAINIANYIIDNNATVRQTAKQFGISKSTVHIDVT